jgi:hypothetical protein
VAEYKSLQSAALALSWAGDDNAPLTALRMSCGLLIRPVERLYESSSVGSRTCGSHVPTVSLLGRVPAWPLLLLEGASMAAA